MKPLSRQLHHQRGDQLGTVTAFDFSRKRPQLAVSHQRSRRSLVCRSCKDSIQVDRFHPPCPGEFEAVAESTLRIPGVTQDYRPPRAEGAPAVRRDDGLDGTKASC